MLDEDRLVFAFYNTKVKVTERECAILDLLIKYEEGLYAHEIVHKLSYTLMKSQVISALSRIKNKLANAIEIEKKKGEPYKIKKYYKHIDK